MQTINKLRGAYPFSWRLIVVVFWTIVALGFTFTQSAANNNNIANGAAIAIVVVGLSWLTGWSGQISVGNSGFMAFGGYTVAVWSTHHNHSNIFLVLLMATVIGALSGLVLGIPATRLRGPYLAGMTIAFAVAVPGIASQFGSWTGGPSGNLFLNPLVAPTWFANLFSGPTAYQDAQNQWGADIAICIAGLVLLLMANLFRSRTGRAMRMIRDNDVAAELAGVNLTLNRTLAFVIAAGLGGLAGGLQVLLASSITPYSFNLAVSIEVLTLMVLGGMGTLSGAVIAGVIYAYSGTLVTWIRSGLGISATSSWGLNLQGILYPLLLIVTMLIAPVGIAGGFSKLWRLAKLKLASRRKVLPSGDIAST